MPSLVERGSGHCNTFYLNCHVNQNNEYIITKPVLKHSIFIWPSNISLRIHSKKLHNINNYNYVKPVSVTIVGDICNNGRCGMQQGHI